MKFRKRPLEVEAIQYTGTNVEEIRAFARGSVEVIRGKMILFTLENPLQASAGDWIIKGVKGEFYPCNREVFDLTYEPIPARS